MAISVFMNYHSGRDAVMLYESVIAEMRTRGEAIHEGLIYHMAAVVPHGMFIADAWETRDAFNTFAAVKTLPLIEKRGLVSPDVEFADVCAITNSPNDATHGCAIVMHFDGNADDLLRKNEEVNGMTGFAKQPPPGFQFEWLAKRSSGICAVQHWLTWGDFETFFKGPQTQAMQAAGLSPPRLEYYDIYNTIDGRAVHAQAPV